MSVNSLSTSVGERSTPDINPVVKPSELVNSASVKVDTNVASANQDLTKPVLAKDKVTLDSVDTGAKGSASTADNINTVSGKVEPPAKQDDQKSLLDSLQKLTETTNQLTPLQNRKLEFTTSQESGRTVVKVIDKDSNDIIRQIPSEEFIKVAEKINDLSEQVNDAQGLLFESKV